MTTHALAVISMTSLELLEFINSNKPATQKHDIRHDNLMARIPVVIGESGALHMKGTYIDSQNKERPCYHLPKREACLVAMSYSYELQALVFDRMTQLELALAPTPQPLALPRTFADALRAYADEVEKNEVLQLENESMRPAVAVVERIVDSRGNKSFREVAKILGLKEKAFIAQLVEEKIIYRIGGSLVPYAEDRLKDLFEVTVGEAYGHCYKQTRVTPRGLVWLATRYAIEPEPAALELLPEPAAAADSEAGA